MKQEIIRLAKNNKISAIGFCDVDKYIEREKDVVFTSAFASHNDDERKNPRLILDNAQSIIVCLFNYYNGEQVGNISRYAQGLDYHLVTKSKMSCIQEYLHQKGYHSIAFSDIGDLDEKLLAVISGVGFRGKNNLIINKSMGSYFFIGYIITDCLIEADDENVDKCLECNKCINSCPLGALKTTYFDENKCVSYITQKKDDITMAEKDAMNAVNSIWGCDRCQEVCPYNTNLSITDISEFKTDLIINLKINESQTNKEFKKEYGNRAFAWRGKNILNRNQNIVNNRKKVSK